MPRKNKLVNIVAIKDGWILHKIAERLNDGLHYAEWTEKPNKKSRITYYINYAQAADTRQSEIECALFTHFEEGVEDLKKKWWQVAKTTDVAICMSQIYAKQFGRNHANALVIPPGVDLEDYTIRPLRIGVIGTAKSTGRKGEDLIKNAMGIDGIEWCFTGKGWPGKAIFLDDKDMPDFYKNLDYVLVASSYEGGPMCVIEALASGVAVIGPDVGWIPELPHIPFKNGDQASLNRVLKGLVSERQARRNAVQSRTWKNFINRHDDLFTRLDGLEKGQISRKQIKRIISGV